MIQLGIIGVNGRMGARVLDLALNDPEIAKPLIGITAQDDLSSRLLTAHVAIDFSTSSALEQNLAQAVKLRKPLVIGTTGHFPASQYLLEAASKNIPVLYSPNFSLGMALCLQAAKKLRQSLECTVEILETHHTQKKDLPSGTALQLAEALGNPPIQSVRTGEVIGEHTVIFTCQGEQIEIKHTALSRDLFAQGALSCAKFLIKQPPGLYSVKDLFP
jgi:4-hydroxy-tetrahydrodipicolinate reductase